MMDTLQITVEDRPAGTAVLTLAGSLDASGTPKLTEQCEALVSRGVSRLIIHLAQINFISSSGIGTLLMLSEDLEEDGGAVVLVELSPEVESVFTILDLEEVLTVAASVGEAMTRLRMLGKNDDEELRRSA